MKKALAITLLAVCGGVTLGVANQAGQNLTEVSADIPIEEYRHDAIMAVNAAFIDVERKGNNKYYLSEIDKIREDANLAISNSDSHDEISHIVNDVIYDMNHFKNDEEVWEEFISNILYPFDHYYYGDGFNHAIDELEAFVNDYYEKTEDLEKYTQGSNAIGNFRNYTDVVRAFTDLYKYFVTFDCGDTSDVFLIRYEEFFLENLYIANGFNTETVDIILGTYKGSDQLYFDKATAYSEVMNYYMTFFDYELADQSSDYKNGMKGLYEYANNIALASRIDDIENCKSIILNGMMKVQSEFAFLPRLKVLIESVKVFQFADEYKAYLEDYESLYEMLYSEIQLKVEDDYNLFVIAKNSYTLFENYNSKFLAIKDLVSDNLWSLITTKLNTIESTLSLLTSESIMSAENQLDDLYQLVLAKINTIDYISRYATENVNTKYLADYKDYEDELDKIMFEVQPRIEGLSDLAELTAFVGDIVDQIDLLNDKFDSISELENMFDSIREFYPNDEYGDLLLLYKTKYDAASNEVKEYSSVAMFLNEFNIATSGYNYIKKIIDEKEEVFEANKFNDYQIKTYNDSIRRFVESLKYNLTEDALDFAIELIEMDNENLISISNARKTYINNAKNVRSNESFTTNKEEYDALIAKFETEIHEINSYNEMEELFVSFEEEVEKIESDNQIAVAIINSFNQLPAASFTVDYLSPLGNLYADYMKANDTVKSLIGDEFGAAIVNKFEEARTLGINIINEKVAMTLSYLSEEQKADLLNVQATAVDGLTNAINAKGMWYSYSTFMDVYNNLIYELSDDFVDEIYSFYFEHISEDGDVHIELDEVSIVLNFYVELNAKNQDIKDDIEINVREVGDKLLTASEMLSNLLMAYLVTVDETANQIKAAIDLIPSTITLSDEDTILSARELVNQVTNADVIKILTDDGYFNKLEEAENKLAELKIEEQIRLQVEVVETLIDAIGEVTLESENAINTARNAYDNASAEVKNIVELDGKLTVLVAAEKAYQDLLVAHDLEVAKTSAKEQLETYAAAKDASKYDEAGLAALSDAVLKGKEAIDNAGTLEDIIFALGYAQAKVDAVPEYIAPVEPIKSGCGSSLIAASTIITLISLLGAGLISIKRKQD